VTEWDPDQQELAEQSHLRSYALLPLAHEGSVIAAFIVGSVRRDAFQPAFKRALEAAAAQLGSALDRIRTAEQLRRAELRYRLLLDDIGEGAGVVDPDERFLSANAAAHAIFGVPQGTLAGRSLAEFTTPETESAHDHDTFTALLFHPMPFAARLPLGAGLRDSNVMTGAVASYLNDAVPVPWLPASSRQCSVTEALAVSGPLYTAPGSQLSMLLVASDPTAR
jgi:PAS domain-containing protein